ncbi:hypothetical protein LTR10_023063 [Elasticomyces elasticus]|uniref:Ubiquitin-like protease family profile domain-containing protein n=1 Tax=Exophiala sideris TaxID=1016849 RepID=A0ABR0IVD0_9EURO|nr:hypothetical protein LTR10_023063 [Elasticomyces elasticus]KAK5021092.1 hypothetical protein LTS07_011245 [Exophiala sideris]KAK5023290.1 hypothetical protein LTR13_011280 [Exophiala sideris]KAK5048801.1 hypothetical protein LTR69_011264 [Exophiala sideris]KAK5176262.1 hypothetical protein LTR44_011193 [Eurotiomycetes sp. CCFEE 6388]
MRLSGTALNHLPSILCEPKVLILQPGRTKAAEAVNVARAQEKLALLPVQLDDHWILLIIDPKGNAVYHIDPARGSAASNNSQQSLYAIHPQLQSLTWKTIPCDQEGQWVDPSIDVVICAMEFIYRNPIPELLLRHVDEKIWRSILAQAFLTDERPIQDKRTWGGTQERDVWVRLGQLHQELRCAVNQLNSVSEAVHTIKTIIDIQNQVPTEGRYLRSLQSDLKTFTQIVSLTGQIETYEDLGPSLDLTTIVHKPQERIAHELQYMGSRKSRMTILKRMEDRATQDEQILRKATLVIGDEMMTLMTQKQTEILESRRG